MAADDSRSPAGSSNASDSRANLLRYLTLREHDLRPLQEQLSRLGLSSLGRMEAHVDGTLSAVLLALHRIAEIDFDKPTDFADESTFASGDELLQTNSEEILGPVPASSRDTHIMVTMPSEAADDPRMIRDLVAAGMSVMRINCAHDSKVEWTRMVQHLRSAERQLGRTCRVAFDLAGPKLRTGELESGPAVRRFRPRRDAFGRTLTPARVRVVTDDLADRSDAVPVDGGGLQMIALSTSARLMDTRGRRRTLEVSEVGADEAVLECDRTCYLAPGSVIELFDERERLGAVTVLPFQGPVQPIELEIGDRLIVAKGAGMGSGPIRDARGRVKRPARVFCDTDALFEGRALGERILFDDGAVSGLLRSIEPDALTVEVVGTAKSKARLRPNKGINVPDSRLDIPSLTTRDLEDLEDVHEMADIVSLSFVREPSDVDDLLAAIEHMGADHLSIVLKIETREAFENLGQLLLSALGRAPVAVMIARGDLGVEIGFERMAEVQEQILWICEAAHVPVIWATQVLESLAKRGAATRAEISDASLSSRAECVMLNKGPHIVAAVKTLSDILARMANHHTKKTARLRPLTSIEWPDPTHDHPSHIHPLHPDEIAVLKRHRCAS